MNRAFVLGNGVSRRDIDLTHLKTLGTIYGCNAIYREFVPDVLVSTDTPISTRIQESGYPMTNRFYTRRPNVGQGSRHIPQPYFGFSSGPVAVGIAAIDKNVAIYLIGFDMGPGESGKFNNIYADTEFYRRSNTISTYTGNWIKQLAIVTKGFPKTSFFRVVGTTTADIPALNSIKNLHHMPMDDFLNRINNTREL